MKMEGKVKEPHSLKPRVLLWADVSYNDMEEIDNIKDIPKLERTLCCVLAVDYPEPRRGVLLELYVHTVLFCRQNNFNREQTSALISIVKCMHQANTETPLNNMDHCFAYCSELLLCHSVRRPPFSINLFNSEQVTHILKYFLNSYIRHFNLYKYIFTPQVRLDLSLCYSGMSNEEEPPSEDSVSLEDGDSVTETEPKTDQEKEPSAAEQDLLSSAPEGTGAAGPSHRSELKAIIQQEVRQEMMRMSALLEQSLKESADQLTSAMASLETNLQGRK